jgi:CubicO group peptidase (beta-lactamase class C family)
MNKRITIGVLFFLFTTFQSCGQLHQKDLARLPLTNSHNSLDSSQAEIVYKYAQHFPNGTQLSLCIITGDSEKYFGIERRNDSLVYIDNSNRIFEIGSITKSFTGIMLAKLVYDGKVDPNEPIKNILPIKLKQSSLNGKEITLVNLANHTSGLPFEPVDVKNDNIPFVSYDRYDPYRNYSVERLYNYLSNKMVLQPTPGEIRKYSNLDLALLGHILTLITGKSYEQLLFETICNPLGMQYTFVTFNDDSKRLLVQGRDENGKPINCGDNQITAFVGAGGIKSTAKDLVKYLRANMNDTTYFYQAQKTTKVTDEHLTESLGWETYSEFGKHHVGAFGATGGYTSGIIFERNEHVGVVVLTNVSAYLASQGNYTYGLCRGLYDPLPFASKKGK